MTTPVHSRHNPRFSVVIAAFNAAHTIASAVGSVLSQTQADFEVIVVDDGSTDGTGRVVDQINDPRVRLTSQANSGPAIARNSGIGLSHGQYVAFLDSDDLWLPRYLELAGGALDEAESPGFAYTDAYAFDSSSGLVRHRTAMQLMRPPSPPPPDRDGFLFQLLKRNFVYVSTTVPRSVLDEVGGYNGARFAAADYDLWLRILARGYVPTWVPGQNALYRIHPGQMSGDAVGMSRDIWQVYLGLDIDALPTAEHRALLSRRCRAAERQLKVVQGDARILGGLRRLRQRIGRARQRSGLGESWYDTPPDEVAAAFPDLTTI